MPRLETSLLVCRLATLSALLLFAMTPTTAQTDPSAGAPSFSLHQGGSYDQVDPATGNIILTIPVRNKIGKIPFRYSLVGNSHANPVVNVNNHNTKQWSVSSGSWNSFLLKGSSLGDIGLITSDRLITCGTDHSDDETYNYVIVDPSGASHSIPTVKVDVDGCDGSSSGTATDGSGYSMSITNSPFSQTIYDRSGNKIVGSGNIIDPDGVGISSTGTVYTDTFNTTALTNSVHLGPTSDTYTFLGGDGNPNTVTVKYTNLHQKTAFGCALINDVDTGTNANYLPTTITTPNGNFTITYETTFNNSPDVTGRIAKITYPEGGSVTYTYSGGDNGVDNHGVSCSSSAVPTLARQVNDGLNNISTWTYVNSNTSSTLTNFTVKVTDPANNLTQYNFSGELQTQKQAYQGTSTLLRTEITCYDHNFSSCPTALVGTAVPITQTDVFEYPTGSTNASLVETKFDGYGNIAETKNYDFGAATTKPPTAAPTILPLVAPFTFANVTVV